VKLLRCGDECDSVVLYASMRNLLQQLLKEWLHPRARLLADRRDDLRSIHGEVAYESGDLLFIGTLTELKECGGCWKSATRCDSSA